MAMVEAVLALMAACIALAVLARFAGLPCAAVLILAGSAIAFIPGLPDIALNPELALAFFLPPLLQASAFRTDWPAFRRKLRPILLPAMGCVAFTAFFIGWVSLAAALALRLNFPEHDLIIFLAFCAILATLEWLIKRLGLAQPPHPNGIDPEEAHARHVAAEAMLGVIQKRAADVLYGPIASDLPAAAAHPARRAVRLEAIDAARAAVPALQSADKLTENLLTKLSQELDFEESRLRGALG